MSDGEEGIEIVEGMPVVSEDGEDLGTVAAMLVDEDEDALAFLLVTPPGGGEPRLTPVEAVADASDENLVLGLTPQAAADLPALDGERDPTDEEIDRAYEVAGLR